MNFNSLLEKLLSNQDSRVRRIIDKFLYTEKVTQISPAKVISVDSNESVTIALLTDITTPLSQALKNKTGETLESGDSVWVLHLYKKPTQGFIIYKK